MVSLLFFDDVEQNSFVFIRNNSSIIVEHDAILRFACGFS